MNPASTLRLRRLTGFFAACWALLAIGLSVSVLVSPRSELALPVNCSFVAGVAVVHWASPEAHRAGVSRGDRMLRIDGTPTMHVIRAGTSFLRPGVPNDYEFRKRSGRVLNVSLTPTPADTTQRTSAVLLHLGLLAVSALYLLMGAIVWWNKSERAEGWAFHLFCCSVSVLAATAIRIDLIPWSASRVLANFPLLGATAFHFFTSYPIEPDWIVRHRRIQVVPYGVALLIALAVLSEEALGIPPEWVAGLALCYGAGLGLVSIMVLARQRRPAREAGLGDRADFMLLASVVSFLPALLVLIAEYFISTPLPWYVAMLWLAFFPVAVGYGMLRKQLFEFRLLARSSAAYGATSLAITGVFALLITFADVAVELVGLNVRSVQVAFLFLAIIAFDPLRRRLQRLVDGIFDRDRARYRVVVREISEAMVSMLSLREIGDRILVALTDTMGVERAMVLLFDESDRVLRPMAWRGDWDDDGIRTEIPAEHSIWKHLWMRREELSRVDFDDEPDPENREACWDVFDTLEIELLVPILFGVDLLGVIAVGRKLSGERLVLEDRQLMRTLANQSSIAIENAKAFDEIAKLNETLEARVEERTRELRETQTQLMQSEKMSSLGQLVAGVAHELNNPIGFVHANLQLLDEYIQKLVEGQRTETDSERIREAIGKLISRSREG
ncbi:MAG: GAF domain-containing protein, partial [Proteobacteria bacterium]|nr:GAF domain-containing protein [Pseudomonadota bacterium]